jgi:ABC-2 type transport system ATP-binding protein
MTEKTHVSFEIKGVYKKMGLNQALDGITTLFDASTLHGLIGPDGAGKTTLLRCLIGLLKPNSGEILYFQEQSQVPFSNVRDGLAYMPQQQSLYPDLSIDEHLEFFRDLYQIPPEIYSQRRDELLQLARLAQFKDRPAGQLSGGMYKKLGLMCALLRSPSAVLLDEPTNGVDPISRREFWDMLYRLVGQGVLVLISTAYMDEAERCGKVHILSQGKLLGCGEPQKVLDQEKARNFEELFMRHDQAVSAQRKK